MCPPPDAASQFSFPALSLFLSGLKFIAGATEGGARSPKSNRTAKEFIIKHDYEDGIRFGGPHKINTCSLRTLTSFLFHWLSINYGLEEERSRRRWRAKRCRSWTNDVEIFIFCVWPIDRATIQHHHLKSLVLSIEWGEVRASLIFWSP